jgi:vancomycin resistance protein YoaR
MPSVRSLFRSRTQTIVIVVVLVVVALPFIGSLVEHVVYSGKVLPGVTIDGAPSIAAKSDSAAFDAITRRASDLDRQPILVRAGDQNFTFQPSLINYTIDVPATIQRARAVGRTGNVFAMVGDTLLRRIRTEQVPLVVHYDPLRFAGLLDGWANAINHGMVEGGLRFQGTTVVPIEPHAGTGLEREEAADRLQKLLTSAQRSPLELPIGNLTPQVDAAAVASAASRARALLTASYRVTTRHVRVTLTPRKLAGTLGTRVAGNALELTIDPQKLRLALGSRIALFSHAAVPATFRITEQNTPEVVPSRDGTAIDFDAIGAAILAGQRSITAAVHRVHPAHDTAWARKVGIVRQVSSFTTMHPAGQPRVHNIHVAADTLNNTIVEPGKVFSLNAKLGQRTPAKGYVKAPILIEDGFGDDYGGGVSQLATTLYNAEFFGGYEDVTHTTHAYYISRYPMGREATVNYPFIDLKFRDNTRHGVLIRTSYNDTSITVTLYGDNYGRVVHEENRREFNPVPVTDKFITCPAPATIDLTDECPYLAAGEKFTAQTGEPGWDASFDRVIDQPGKPELRHHYSAHYPMLQNKVLEGVGPATSLPPTTPTTPSTPSTSAPKTPRTSTTKP